MIRPIRTVFAIAFLAAGAALGALNPALVSVDLGIARFEAALGVVILVSLLGGVLIGGLALTVSVVLPMRHRSRRDRKTDAQAIAQSLSKGPAVARSEGLRTTAPGDVEHELRQ